MIQYMLLKTQIYIMEYTADMLCLRIYFEKMKKKMIASSLFFVYM
jgi:hypothetical protein